MFPQDDEVHEPPLTIEVNPKPASDFMDHLKPPTIVEERLNNEDYEEEDYLIGNKKHVLL